jgi:alpha-galactosidase
MLYVLIPSWSSLCCNSEAISCLLVRTDNLQGWYADETDWWDSVGEWKPSDKRFPNGFKALIKHIADTGMIPGCWLEPEVVGIRSPIANALPEEAFFQENGVRVVEKRRYQLDYRCSAVIERMDRIIDELVTDYGIGYFKFDYNVDLAQGTDIDAFSPGAGHIGHQRAYLRWVEDLFDRHQGLVIENCSSGGQRLDYASLAVHSIQSTSDQQDPIRYAAVSAAILTAVAPEQAASWAYPQPEWDDEKNIFSVVNTLMGRVHLSGRIDKLNEHQLGLIKEGMNVYKKIRGDIAESEPFWPLGLPGWRDEWLATGLKTKGGDVRYLAVWRRGGDASCSLPITNIGGKNVEVEVLYPAVDRETFKTSVEFDAEAKALEITLPATVCARLLRIGLR